MVLSKMRSVNTSYGLQNLNNSINMYNIGWSYFGSREHYEFHDCGRYIAQRSQQITRVIRRAILACQTCSLHTASITCQNCYVPATVMELIVLPGAQI